MFRAAILLLMLLATPATAQTAIHRCIGADGSAVFTDQPCTALQATPITPRAEPESPAPAISAPPPILCATTSEALRQSVIDAFARRDANRLAGLMLWHGQGRNAVIADIRSLGELIDRQLLDVQLPSAPDDGFASSFDMPATPVPDDDALVLHLAGDDGSGRPLERRFGLVREAGCLWLRNEG